MAEPGGGAERALAPHSEEWGGGLSPTTFSEESGKEIPHYGDPGLPPPYSHSMAELAHPLCFPFRHPWMDLLSSTNGITLCNGCERSCIVCRTPFRPTTAVPVTSLFSASWLPVLICVLHCVSCWELWICSPLALLLEEVGI